MINDNKIEIKYEMNKTLKELKEMAIVLRQKLDTLESEKNVMDVEYSQVYNYYIFYAMKLCRYYVLKQLTY